MKRAVAILLLLVGGWPQVARLGCTAERMAHEAGRHGAATAHAHGPSSHASPATDAGAPAGHEGGHSPSPRACPLMTACSASVLPPRPVALRVLSSGTAARDSWAFPTGATQTLPSSDPPPPRLPV